MSDRSEKRPQTKMFWSIFKCTKTSTYASVNTCKLFKAPIAILYN